MSFKHRVTYVGWVALAVAFTWLLHEFAHWAMGSLLGYEMKMTLNTAGLVEGAYGSEVHRTFVRFAGPAVTLLQALVVFFLLSKRPDPRLYPFLFVPFYMRLLAGAINFIELNDEGAVSQALGLGTYTVPILMAGTLLALVVLASRRASFKARLTLGTTTAVMFFSSILILADQALKIRLL